MKTLMEPSREIPAALSKSEWEALYPQLLLCATRLHRTIRGVQGAPAPRDLVQDAIVDVLSGKRIWPRHTKLLPFLCMVIKSKVSHIVNSAYVMRRVSMNGIMGRTTETNHLSRLERDEILRIVQGDELLVDIVHLLFEDPSLAARDIAHLLDLPVEDIYTANRRLKRKLERQTDDRKFEDDKRVTPVHLGPKPVSRKSHAGAGRK